MNKNGGIIWEKTYGGPYLEKADDIVVLEDGGFGLIGDKCNHGYDIGRCSPKAKVLFMRLNEHGDLLEEQEWSGLNFLSDCPSFQSPPLQMTDSHGSLSIKQRYLGS